MKSHSPKTWWIVKAKITARFGTVAACAARLRCSDSSIRKAVDGLCPDVAIRLKREIHGVKADQPEFPINPAGNFYESKGGFMVHRFDAYDAYASACAGAEGLKLYDKNSGLEVTPDEWRAASLDKDAEDRNLFLKETTGGTAAIPAGVMTRCMNQGRGKCVAANVTDKFGLDDIPLIFPPDWLSVIDPNAPRLGLGYDIATTTKKKSNPSSITLMQQIGAMFLARLIIRFKTADPAIARAIIDHILISLSALGLKVRGLSVDASNERFYAIETRKYFAGRLPVHLVVSGETLQYRGETITFKSYLGNDLINTAADGYLAVPPCDWIDQDWRLVKLDKGMFYADVDASGNHADSFDSTKAGQA